MRVGIVYETTFPEFKGGIERWFKQLAEGLGDQSIDVQYFNTSGKNDSTRGVQYIALESKANSFHMSGKRSASNALTFAISVFKGFRDIEVDVVYLSSFPFFHIWASKLARKIHQKKFKIYVEWFELPSAKFWVNEFGFLMGVFGFLIQRMSVRLSDINVAHMESTLKQLVQLQTRRQITLKLPGICMSEYENQNPTFNLEKRNICQIGRLTTDKQPILSLKAIKILWETGWKGHFHLIGSGPLEKKISNFVIQQGMSRYVTLHVDANDNLREQVLKSSVALLHPSKREGFGLAIVEAAALGVPTILIKGPNNKSTELRINPTLISESDDPQELVTLLKEVLANPKKYIEECHRWNIEHRSNMLGEDSIIELTAYLRSHQKTEEE